MCSGDEYKLDFVLATLYVVTTLISCTNYYNFACCLFVTMICYYVIIDHALHVSKWW